MVFAAAWAIIDGKIEPVRQAKIPSSRPRKKIGTRFHGSRCIRANRSDVITIALVGPNRLSVSCTTPRKSVSSQTPGNTAPQKISAARRPGLPGARKSSSGPDPMIGSNSIAIACAAPSPVTPRIAPATAHLGEIGRQASDSAKWQPFGADIDDRGKDQQSLGDHQAEAGIDEYRLLADHHRYPKRDHQQPINLPDPAVGRRGGFGLGLNVGRNAHCVLACSGSRLSIRIARPLMSSRRAVLSTANQQARREPPVSRFTRPSAWRPCADSHDRPLGDVDSGQWSFEEQHRVAALEARYPIIDGHMLPGQPVGVDKILQPRNGHSARGCGGEQGSR